MDLSKKFKIKPYSYLLLIYINNLPPENLTGNTALFADDPTISVSKYWQHNLEAERTHKWCEDNGNGDQYRENRSHAYYINTYKDSRLTEA